MEIRTAQDDTTEEELKNLDIKRDFAHFSIKWVPTYLVPNIAIAELTIKEHLCQCCQLWNMVFYSKKVQKKWQ